MRYTQPKITGTFSAVTTIKSKKISNNVEAITGLLTSGPLTKRRSSLACPTSTQRVQSLAVH